MKKLMFAVAALAAGVACAEITSANVVGYQTTDLAAGYTMTGPSFINVGDSTTMDLTSITVGGPAYEAGASEGDVTVQLLNHDGTLKGAYTWLDLEGDFEPGWYDDDYEAIAVGDVVFKAGDSAWVQGANGLSLTYSGQVLSSTAVTVPLRSGYTPVANPFPVALDLTKITVGGSAYEPGASEGDVTIQFLNHDGTLESAYTWLDLDGDFEPGWYDDDYEAIAVGDVVLEGSDGMWVQGADNLNLVIPALVL